MAYSLLAHLYPRIRGSQEDVATFSLAYILEQSGPLNSAFTKMICKRLHLDIENSLVYKCQDAAPDLGRPDIAGYEDGKLRILCEAKFYAGLTSNQPVSYLQRLAEENEKENGLIFICPRPRIIAIWNKVRSLAEEAGFEGVQIDEYCMKYSGTTMSIISWGEITAELMRIAMEQDPERQGDLKQLQGFCEKIDSESFIPFRPEDFSAQTARDIDRYYQVVDETFKMLKNNDALETDTKGLRKSPRWQGYSQYIRINGVAVSIDYLRKPWKAPSSVETPFWTHIEEVVDGKWQTTDKVKQFMSTIDGRLQEDFYGYQYLALTPSPYLSLEEIAGELAIR